MRDLAARCAAALFVLAALGSSPVGAEETARQILDRRKALDDTTRHWDDRYQRMALDIFDRRGGKRERRLELYERRYPEDEMKAILFFDAPAEVKGTAVLAFTHKGREGEQWLYLPALKRVRQISGGARREKFVGTDLSYHDLDIMREMASWTEEDARSSLRGVEDVQGTPSHVIELVPQRSDIEYARIVLWLSREALVSRQLEFWEKGEAEPVKRVSQGDIREIGAVPVPYHLEVVTPSKSTRTVIRVEEVRLDEGLEDDLFSQRWLERGPPL